MNDNNILTSVVIATYNGEKYISEQLKSILDQTVIPNEIIICDDKSTDKTLEKVNEIIKSSGVDFIKVVKNEKNLGFIDNFRHGLSLCSGEYIFLCDQDDLWEKDKIKITLNEMKKNNALGAGSGFRLIDGSGKYIHNLSCYKSSPIIGYQNWSNTTKKVTLSNLIWGNFIPGCTCCFKKEIVPIFLKINNKEVHHDFQLLMISANNKAAIYIDRPLSCYRMHGNNTIGMNRKKRTSSRHMKPRLVRFLDELQNYSRIDNKIRIYIILYCRFPKIRADLLDKFHLPNKIRLESI